MKRVLFFKLIVILTLICYSNVHAQPEAGVTLGPQFFTNGGGTGLGGALHGRYWLQDNLRIGLNFGFYSWSESDASLNIIPISGSVEYVLALNQLNAFAGADLGAYIISAKADTGFGDFGASSTKLGLAPTIGVEYPLNDKLTLHSNLKYNLLFVEGGSGFLGLNLGLILKL